MKHLKLFENFLKSEENSEDINEGAFHIALFKARNEGLKEFEFKGKTYPVKEKKIDESSVQEAFEVHYSDGVRGMQKFNDKSKALSFMKDKIENAKGLKDIAVYNAGSNFHSTADTDAVITWWGDGSYLDNVSKKDSALASKKLSESVISEAILSKSAAYHLAHKMLNYAVDNEMIPASKKTKENIDSMSDSLFNAKLDLKKDPKDAAHKILNGLVDRGLISASKKTQDHIDKLADKLSLVELNEGMVQVAGKNKPAGAQVLSSIIIGALIEKGYMKPGADKVKNLLVEEVQKIIMENTF